MNAEPAVATLLSCVTSIVSSSEKGTRDVTRHPAAVPTERAEAHADWRATPSEAPVAPSAPASSTELRADATGEHARTPATSEATGPLLTTRDAAAYCGFKIHRRLAQSEARRPNRACRPPRR